MPVRSTNTLVFLPARSRSYRILHELPEPYKEVFSLRVFGQLSFRDIGELFGKTENWACVVYHRARAKIQSKTEGSL